MRTFVFACLAALACGSLAQTAELVSRDVAVSLDSGIVANKGKGAEPVVVFTKVLKIPGAQWARLRYEHVSLSGDESAGNASILRVTSIRDGAYQTQNRRHVREWESTSAYLNGDAFRVEIIAYPNTGPNRIHMSIATIGDAGEGVASICDGADNRALSSDPRAARYLSSGCTAWMINDTNQMFLMAGHCGASTTGVVQFNVPLSNANGSINHPPPSDQYNVSAGSIQSLNGGVGQDWAYFGVNANSTTGKTPFQAQGQRFTLRSSAPPPAGEMIRITGYGTVSSPVSPTWNQVQKTHAGPYFSMSGTTVRYRTDTTGGNSGSPVIFEPTGEAIGIHTHGGCGNGSGSNAGTAIHHSGIQNALVNPLGICRSGRAAVAPPIYVFGDDANNFGTVNSVNGAFGKVSEFGAQFQGLAYNANSGLMYAIDNLRNLYTVNPATGAVTLLGLVTGTGSTINGLGYEPSAQRLYGIAAATGQLFSIDTSTLAASAIGAPAGGNVAGIDFDPVGGVLYGIDDNAGGTRLIRIDTSNGSQTVVGSLGIGAADCNGLAFDTNSGSAYTINAADDRAYAINAATGAATLVGLTNGAFGVMYGMASVPLLQDVLPTSFSFFRGSHVGGGIVELFTSNNVYVVGAPLPPVLITDPSVGLEIVGTSPLANPAELKIRVETSTSAAPPAGLMQVVLLFDYVAGVWVQVDSRAATGGDNTIEAAAGGSLSRFVQAGTMQMRARIAWHDGGALFSPAYLVRIDQSIWRMR
jgi:V8-like Glu-specific endopeptidase